MAKHRWLRRTLGLGLLAGAAYAVWRAIEANRVPGESEWEPQPFPFPPQPRTTPRPASPHPPDAPSPSGSLAPSATHGVAERADAGEAVQPFVVPADGACPASHPVKAKESSRIFHVPGGQSYDRTVPDRCYVDTAAAEADGFRAAKR